VHVLLQVVGAIAAAAMHNCVVCTLRRLLHQVDQQMKMHAGMLGCQQIYQTVQKQQPRVLSDLHQPSTAG
jgi:hypothetical protein